MMVCGAVQALLPPEFAYHFGQRDYCGNIVLLRDELQRDILLVINPLPTRCYEVNPTECNGAQ